MRTALCLLSVACLVSVASAQPQAGGGVVFVGDVPTIDKALLQAAELPLPPAVSQGPRSAPRVAAPTLPSTRAAAKGFRAATTDSAVGDRETASEGGGLFSKLKRSWPFGQKKETAQPVADPFAQAQLRARRAVAIQAEEPRKNTIRDSAVQPIPTVAHHQSASTASYNGSPTRPGSRHSIGRSNRNSGLVTRKQATPSGGLLSGLFGGTKPKPEPNPAVAQAKQPQRLASQPPRVAPKASLKPPRQVASRPELSPAAELAALAKSRGSVSIGKRRPRAAATVIVSDDNQTSPTPGPAAPLKLADRPKPTTKATLATVTKPNQKPIVIAAVPAPPLPTIVKALEPTPEPAAIQPEPLPEPAAVVRIADTAEPKPVALTPELKQPVVELPTVEPMPIALAPAAKAAPPARPIVDRGPSERSRALLAEAHGLAAVADDYEGHSAVIQRCRYVLAIDRSEQARAYAKQLASWALTKRGELLDTAGRLEEAVVDYREALSCDAECWKAEHALGVIAASHGKNAAANRHFDRVIELNPEHAKAFANRAVIAVRSGDYRAALDDYAEAIAINPDLAIAHTGRGRVCHLLGELEEGLRHLDAAAVLDPTDASIATGRGDLLTDLGRYGQAITAYNRAIALNPGLASAHRNLAWLRATCPVSAFRDGDAALASAEIAERLAPASDMALDTKAAALATLGRFEEAARLQREAIDLAPEEETAHYRERLAMYEQGKTFTSTPVAVQRATYLK